MKIMINLVFLVILSTACNAMAVTGDVNGDGRVGLDDAVHALQVTSGEKTFILNNDQEYDLTEYMAKPGTKHYYHQVHFIDYKKQEEMGIISYGKETVDDQEVFADKYESGLWSDEADYYVVNGHDIQLIAQKWSNHVTRFNPPIVIGKDDMIINKKIENIFTINDESIYYREFTLLGSEEVTVPAGTFQCLKVLQTRSFRGRYIISYLAKDIGLVKYSRANNEGGGYVWELVNVENQDGDMVYENSLCTVQGTWSMSDAGGQQSGTFSMVYTQEDNATTSIVLHDFPYYPTLYLTTASGTQFTPAQEAYGDDDYDGQPDVPEIHLDVDGETITGSYTYYDYNDNSVLVSLTGTIVCN